MDFCYKTVLPVLVFKEKLLHIMHCCECVSQGKCTPFIRAAVRLRPIGRGMHMVLHMKIPNPFAFLFKRSSRSAPTAEDFRREFREKASDLRSDLTDFNVGEKSREFFSLVHSSFARLLGLSSSATYSELKKIAKNSPELNDKYQKDLSAFLDEVAHLEYDFPDFVKDYEVEIAQEKDMALKYLNYLKKKSDIFTRRKLVELDKIILSDEPVSAKRILENYLSRFEELLESFK